jgi:transcriptional regulator with XRE-family HTH domain
MEPERRPLCPERVTAPIRRQLTITKLKLKLLACDSPQYVVAAAAGIHPSRLSLYALGKRDPLLIHLYRLCKVFKCPVEDLLGTVVVEFDDEPKLTR